MVFPQSLQLQLHPQIPHDASISGNTTSSARRDRPCGRRPTKNLSSLRRNSNNIRISSLMLLLVLGSIITFNHCPVHAGWISSQPLSSLLQQHESDIQQLQQQIVASSSNSVWEDACVDPNDSVFFLRYCMELPDDPTERLQRLMDTLEWRSNGNGKSICQAAQTAIAQATTTALSSWNNDVVLDAAPHSSKIKPYLTPKNVLTTTMDNHDLLYCIRAGLIDDNGLLQQVNVGQLVEFFLYVKEIHHTVANIRSKQHNQLLSVITANDLNQVKLIGGSAEFRQGLSQSSKLATQYYPSLAGPTLLLNLPKLVAALVKLFTPLFPPSVNARLKFDSSTTLANVPTLLDITPSGTQRDALLRELTSILTTTSSN